MTQPSVLTVSEVCEILRLSAPSVRKLARTGRLPIAVDSPLRIPRAAVEALARGDGWEAPEPAVTAPAQRPRPIRRRAQAAPKTGYVAALLRKRTG